MGSQSERRGYKSTDPTSLSVPETSLGMKLVQIQNKLPTWWPYPIVVTTVKEKKRELCWFHWMQTFANIKRVIEAIPRYQSYIWLQGRFVSFNGVPHDEPAVLPVAKDFFQLLKITWCCCTKNAQTFWFCSSRPFHMERILVVRCKSSFSSFSSSASSRGHSIALKRNAPRKR